MTSRHATPLSNRWWLGALFLLAAAAVVILWAPWRTEPPAGEGAGRPPVATAPDDSTPLDADANANAATPTTPNAAPSSPSRAPVVARTVLRGTYAAPQGRWPGGGTALLLKAPDRRHRGAMGMFSMGMDIARREAQNRAKRAAGTLDENAPSPEQELLEIVGRTPPIATAALDASGAFVFGDPPPGSYQVVLDHRFLLNAEPVLTDVERDQERDLGVLPTRAGANLLVLVSDEAGEPLSGVELELGRVVDISKFMDPQKLGEIDGVLQRMIPFSGVTDDRGARSFRGLPVEDNWLLEATVRGRVGAYRSFRLLPGRETVVAVELPRGASVRARLRADDGTSMVGARLEIRCPDVALPPRMQGIGERGERTYSRRLVIGEGGEGIASGLPPGRAIVAVRVPGFFPREESVALDVGEEAAVDITLERGIVVRGRVVDLDGQPVPDARVLSAPPREGGLDILDTEKFQKQMQTLQLYQDGVVTSADGQFVIGGFRSGDAMMLAAIAPGYDRGEVETVEAGMDGIEIRLRRLAELRGTVLSDPEGEPVTGFKVALHQRTFLVFDRSVLEDEFADRDDGTFTLTDVPREKFKVVFTAPGRAPLTTDADFSDGVVDLGTVHMLRPASVRGIATDDSGRPLAGVTIRISQGGVSDSLFMAKTLGREMHQSDEHGQFHIEGLTGQRVRLIADVDGYATKRTDSIPLEAGKCTDDVVLRLEGGGSLRGTLIDEDDQPLVGWRAQATHTSGISLRATTTDENGAFGFEGLMPGTHKIDCMPDDLIQRFAQSGAQQPGQLGKVNMAKTMQQAMQWTVSDRVLVRGGEQSEIELVYRGLEDVADSGLVVVRGTVRLGDAELEQGMVFMSRAGSTALGHVAPVENGAFEIAGVEPGTYSCRIQAGILTGGAVGEARTVEVLARSPHQLDIALPGGALRGVVVDQRGNPMGGVTLTLSSSNAAATTDRMDLGEGSVLTRDDGRFAFAGLAEGRYDILAKELLSTGERCARQTDLQLSAGQVREDLVLTLAAGGALRVHVRATGQPRRNGLVTLLDPFGNPLGLFHRSLTDREGRVVFSGLPDGEYRVAVDAPGAAPAVSNPARVSAGVTSDVDVDVSSGIPARVELHGEIPQTSGWDVIVYSIRRADGALLKTGQLMLTEDLIERGDVTRARLPLGTLTRGRYSLRIESARFGVLGGDYELTRPDTVWMIDLPK